MLNWFKKHFIPHPENDHRPYSLRSENIRLIAGIVLIIEFVLFLTPFLSRFNMTGGMASVLPALLADFTNTEREKIDLNTLTTNPLLDLAAEMKAKDMATYGYFAHTSPEGKTPWYWLEKAGYKYQYAGENLAVNFNDSKDVIEAWMKSPTHKANLVKDKYTEMGTAVAEGMYKGRKAIFVAQVYANPVPTEYFVKDILETPSVSSKEIAVAPKPKIEKVLGVEDEKVIELAKISENKKEVALMPTELSSNVSTALDTSIATPISSDKISNPNFFQKILSSPRHTTNLALLGVTIVMLFALLANTFIKIRHFHPDLITNGLTVLVLVFGIFLANSFLSKHDAIITQSTDYINPVFVKQI